MGKYSDNILNVLDKIGIFKAQVEIMARLSGNGLRDKFLRIMEKGGMADE